MKPDAEPRLPVLVRGWLALRAALRRRRQRQQLAVLSDAILKDIGLSRSEALEEARKPCWRR